MRRLVLRLLVLALGLASGPAVVAVAAAQAGSASETTSIYPVFEGWAENPDGSATLVFGYYSAGTRPIEIPPGEENGFEPGPRDRGQPVVFLPGRQRNVCRLIVSAGYEGNLKWRIEHDGAVGETTERGGVDPLYLLEEIGGAYRSTREIDFDSAEHGVCLNGAPTVFAAPSLTAKVGEELALEGVVRDDGLPRASAVTSVWRQVEGPSSVELDVSGTDPTKAHVTFTDAGDYVFELSASDGEASATARVEVLVAE